MTLLIYYCPETQKFMKIQLPPEMKKSLRIIEYGVMYP